MTEVSLNDMKFQTPTTNRCAGFPGASMRASNGALLDAD